jgi:hypothetical protein
MGVPNAPGDLPEAIRLIAALNSSMVGGRPKSRFVGFCSSWPIVSLLYELGMLKTLFSKCVARAFALSLAEVSVVPSSVLRQTFTTGLWRPKGVTFRSCILLYFKGKECLEFASVAALIVQLFIAVFWAFFSSLCRPQNIFSSLGATCLGPGCLCNSSLATPVGLG